MSKSPREIAAAVIEAFGGPSKMARALGHRSVSTVDGWQRSENGIPHWRRLEIIGAAEKAGAILPGEFMGEAPPLTGDGDAGVRPDSPAEREGTNAETKPAAA